MRILGDRFIYILDIPDFLNNYLIIVKFPRLIRMTDFIWTDPKEGQVIQRAKSIKDLGAGGETREVKLLLMRDFPGIGGAIPIDQSLLSVYRVELSSTGEEGHRRYLIHSILKKLDDYFLMLGEYEYPHIARPLGSTADACMYEYLHGSEGFSWYVPMMGIEKVDDILVELADWNTFTQLYRAAGINIGKDITDSESAYVSKNIIHMFSKIDESGTVPRLNELWGRIDFGPDGVGIDYDKFKAYLSDNEGSLRRVLDVRGERFDMLRLASCYLEDPKRISERDKNMPQGDIERLIELAHDFRTSTLRHLT